MMKHCVILDLDSIVFRYKYSMTVSEKKLLMDMENSGTEFHIQQKKLSIYRNLAYILVLYSLILTIVFAMFGWTFIDEKVQNERTILQLKEVLRSLKADIN